MVVSTLAPSVEIDCVQRSFEHEGSEFGDLLSSDYWQMIDYATDPLLLPARRNSRVVALLTKLERHHGYIGVCLEQGAELYDAPDLANQYQSALDQVRDIVGYTTGQQG